MPLIKLQTTASIENEEKEALLSSLSRIVSEAIGKPEQYVMATVEECSIIMSGIAGNAAFADVRSIGGLNSDVNRRISKSLCELLKETLGIESNRVYINFTDIPAGNWGWNESTFG